MNVDFDTYRVDRHGLVHGAMYGKGFDSNIYLWCGLEGGNEMDPADEDMLTCLQCIARPL
jgi:hypothetical protein